MPDDPNVTPTPAPTPPLPNDPAARTTDGTLKDTQAPPSSTDPSASPEPPKPAEPPKAPDSYTFTAPEGSELNQAMVDKATPIFKELGLPQEPAQKLVNLFNEYAKDQSDLAVKAVNEMRANWRSEVNKDPAMSGKLEQVTADIGRLKDSLFGTDKAGRDAFGAAMDLTGAGDHPAIIKAWWKAAQMVNEGQHVSGGGPSTHGQAAPGANIRPTAAQALYPNLPSASH